MEFKTFINAFIRLPCQIINGFNNCAAEKPTRCWSTDAPVRRGLVKVSGPESEVNMPRKNTYKNSPKITGQGSRWPGGIRSTSGKSRLGYACLRASVDPGWVSVSSLVPAATATLSLGSAIIPAARSLAMERVCVPAINECALRQATWGTWLLGGNRHQGVWHDLVNELKMRFHNRSPLQIGQTSRFAIWWARFSSFLPL